MRALLFVLFTASCGGATESPDETTERVADAAAEEQDAGSDGRLYSCTVSDGALVCSD